MITPIIGSVIASNTRITANIADAKNIPNASTLSPKVATYDMQPEMSAYPVADACVELINEDKYDAIILNFANCDMVGHTGFFDACDECRT